MDQVRTLDPHGGLVIAFLAGDIGCRGVGLAASGKTRDCHDGFGLAQARLDGLVHALEHHAPRVDRRDGQRRPNFVEDSAENRQVLDQSPGSGVIQ